MQIAGVLLLLIFILAGCGDSKPDDVTHTSWYQKYSEYAVDHNQKNSLFRNIYASLIVKGVVEHIDEKHLVLKKSKYILCPSSARNIYDDLDKLSIYLHKPLAFVDGCAPLAGETWYLFLLNGPGGTYDFYLESAFRYSKKNSENSVVLQMEPDQAKYFDNIMKSFAFPMIKKLVLLDQGLCITDFSGKEHIVASGKQWRVGCGDKTYVYSYRTVPEIGKRYLDLAIVSDSDVASEYSSISSARFDLDLVLAKMPSAP